ncbi:hypothetical protein C0J52_05281 [Blattella germanica]|nr:hypothetical protein C0J52_05281 [Blattella germanica]
MSKTSPQLVDHENVGRGPKRSSKKHAIALQISDRSVRHFTRRLKSSTRLKMQLATAYFGWR